MEKYWIFTVGSWVLWTIFGSASAYKLTQTYDASNFFDEFTFDAVSGFNGSPTAVTAFTLDIDATSIASIWFLFYFFLFVYKNREKFLIQLTGGRSDSRLCPIRQSILSSIVRSRTNHRQSGLFRSRQYHRDQQHLWFWKEQCTSRKYQHLQQWDSNRGLCPSSRRPVWHMASLVGFSFFIPNFCFVSLPNIRRREIGEGCWLGSL